MRAAVKLGLILGVILGLSPLVGSGWWVAAAVLGIAAVLSLVQGVIAWNRSRLQWFGSALIVNSISAVLLALLLVFEEELSLLWLLGLGAGVLVGLVASAYLTWRQRRVRPTAWRELGRKLERASVVDLLAGRPLKALDGSAPG